MMSKKLKIPKISIIVLTLNEAGYLRKCLESVRRQSYPQDKVEIVVVDNGSTDDSLKIAKSFGARVFVDKKSDVYQNWAFALHQTTGDFVYMIDQDIELRGKNFFDKMLRPMIENQEVVASFTRKYPRKDQPWITRFISYHPAQCDPLYEYLTPPVENSFLKKKNGYVLCQFKLGQVPPFGRMFYRVEYLKKTPNWRRSRISDHDIIVKTIKSGFDKFAYVPAAGLYHHHARSLKHLLLKRTRNLVMHYFPENEVTEYRWLDTGDQKKILRLVIWVIYANLFLPATIRGLVRYLKHRDWALLMEPVVVIATTDAVLWGFVKSKTGRKLMFESLTSLLGKPKSKMKGAFGR